MVLFRFNGTSNNNQQGDVNMKSAAYLIFFLVLFFIVTSGFALTDYEKLEKVILLPQEKSSIEVDLWLDTSNLYFEVGQSNPEIKFTSNQEVFGFVFHYNAKGELLLLWPDPFEDKSLDNKILQGEVKTIPALYTFVEDFGGIEFIQFIAFKKMTNELHAYKQLFAQYALKGEYITENPFLKMDLMNSVQEKEIQNNNNEWNSGVEFFYYNERPSLYDVDFELSCAYSFPFYVDGKMISDKKKRLRLTLGEHLLSYYENNKLKNKTINVSGHSMILVPEGIETPLSTNCFQKENAQKIFVFAVGVGYFKDDTVISLPVCAEDAQGFVQKLRQTYGSDVVFNELILTNENATKDRIQSFLKQGIFSYVDQDTDVYLYFSGHGIQVPDENNDESDGQDEGLIPYDYDHSNPYYTTIIDDDLYKYYRKIGENSKKTFVILDCCFSGGSMKSLIPTKGIDFPFSTKPNENQNQDMMGSEINDTSDNFLFLAATQEFQKAYPNFGELEHSLFTHAIIKALSGQTDCNFDNRIDEIELYDAIKNEMFQVIHSYDTKLDSQEPTLLNPANINFSIPVGN